jgi:hypothetical protein
MPRLHFHVSDEVAETAKARAQAAGKSLSAYLAELVIREVASEWPKDFFDEVAGGWRGILWREPNRDVLSVVMRWLADRSERALGRRSPTPFSSRTRHSRVLAGS